MQPSDFTILRSAAANAGEFDGAVDRLVRAMAAGEIRNVDLQDIKYVLSRAVENAWKVHISKPYFHAGRYSEQPQDVQDLDDSILIMGLHDVISASKKVVRSTAEGPVVEIMRAICAEALPLAHAVGSLKDKVIKGRREPSAPVRPENPNKVVKTCAVCFRKIAVVGGTMAHHGYSRPRAGWQTQSCQGVRFKPLEVSSEGLEWLVEVTRERVAGLKGALDKQATQPEFLLARLSYGSKPEKITRDHEAWPRVFSAHLDEVRHELRSLERELPELTKMLAAWAPQQVEGVHGA